MARTGPFGSLFALGFGLLHRTPRSNLAVIDALRLRPDLRVLDIGCGAGAALERAAEVVTEGRVAGVDPTERLARQASRRVPSATVEVAGVESLPFPDDAFDLAWSISAFHHWPDPEAGLRDARRVLTPGGTIHLAERATPRPGMHGLDPSELDLLLTRLRETGYGRPEVTYVPVRRHRMAVVSALV
jgi:ubiquinone/menaquinone biosynthesis C-methylase UbiE